jgi:hypothetical protein
MSKPHRDPISQTLFIVEGNPTAILVIRTGPRMSQKKMPVASPEAGLAWCRQNGAHLFYSPAGTAAQN